MPLLSRVPMLAELLAPAQVGVALPVRYCVQIAHQRVDPIRYGFTQRSYTWLIDVDAEDAREPGRLVRFAPSDHFSGRAGTLRAGVEAFLRGNGVHVDRGRILMLANPRVLGYVFNPLSLYWCHASDGHLAAVIAEVHNTYGERHAYLLDTDDRGRAETDKQFYVSPFNPVDGRYQMSVPEPAERLNVVITLHREGQRPFVASLRGTRAGTGPTPLRAALRTPLLTRAVMGRIKMHGVVLYLKGLRVQSRPPHPDQKGVSDDHR